MRRIALLLGVDTYSDSTLPNLLTPKRNVLDLNCVLEDPSVGAFDDIVTLQNPPLYDAQDAIATRFSSAKKEDLILLYFSGHGIKDDRGSLYFALSDTRREWPAPTYTAISSDFIKSMIEESRSQRVIILLDCCFSGAFGPASLAPSSDRAGVKELLDGEKGGYGRVVLTATDETRYAWEKEEELPGINNSVFTHFLVEGLRDGSADRNQDGLITIDELYDHIRENIAIYSPKQHPQQFNYRNTQELVVAMNPFVNRLEESLRRAIDHSDAYVRKGALERLKEICHQPSNDDILAQALKAIEKLSRDFNPMVAHPAERVLSGLKDGRNANDSNNRRTKDFDENSLTDLCSIWDVLEVGLDHEFAILRLGIELENPKSWSNIDDEGERTRNASSSVEMKLNSLRDFLKGYFLRYGGYEYLWEFTGALYLFVGADRCDKAAIAVIELFELLDGDDENTPEEIKTSPVTFRFSAEERKILLREKPLGILIDYPLDFLINILLDKTTDSRFKISEDFRDLLRDDHARLFSWSHELKDQDIFELSNEGHTRASMDTLRIKREHATDVSKRIYSIIALPSPGNEDLDKLRFLVDELYHFLHRAADAVLEKLHLNMTDHQDLIDVVESLALLEVDVRERVSFWMVERKKALPESGHELKAIHSFLATKGAEIESLYNSLTRRIRLGEDHDCDLEGSLITESHELQAEADLNSDFYNKVKEFLEGDDIDQEKAFNELFCNPKNKETTLLFLKRASDFDRAREFLSLAWSRVDIVILEDLYSRDSKHNKRRRFISVLSRECSPIDPRFRCLVQIIKNCATLNDAGVREIFRNNRTTYKESYMEPICRSLVVAHPDFNIKMNAIRQVPWDSLWAITVCPSLPGEVLLCLVTRLSADADAAMDIKKIFFDCVRSRLFALSGLEDMGSAEAVNGIIYRLFEFDFFVEDMYFERLSELLKRHVKVCQELNKAHDRFSRYREELEQRKAELGNPAAKLPREIERIPKGVQRSLAREGVYIDYFALHPDPRIALETLRHIKKSNVERIISYRSLNMSLVFELIKKRALFRSRRATELMLHHPKCPKDFARTNLNIFSFRELAQLVSDPNANRNIRDIARLLALRHPGCAVRFAMDNIARLPFYEVERLANNAGTNKQIRKLAAEYVKKFRARRAIY